MIKWLSNGHMRFNTLPKQAKSRNIVNKVLSKTKARVGKNKVLAQGLNTLSLWSYQIVLLFAPSNLGHTLPLPLLFKAKYYH